MIADVSARHVTGPGMVIFDRIGSTLLFALAANTDNLTVGIAYGIKRRRIRWEQNLLIAAVTTLITLVALTVGRQIREVLPPRLPDMLGGGLLVLLAAVSIVCERAGAVVQFTNPLSRFAERTSVGLGESLILSATLSINNIGLAIAGGIGGVTYASAAASIFCLSMAMLALGQAIGTGLTRLRLVSQMLRYSMGGNAVLALAGVLMLAGF
jgi:putative Mn2+ efflux pump MntP